MNTTNCSFRTVTIASLSQSPNVKPSIHSNFTRILQNPRSPPLPRQTLKLSHRSDFSIRYSVGGNGEAENWQNRLPKVDIGAEKVLRLISNATASPICQYVPSPATFLHSVDPRIKFSPLFIFAESYIAAGDISLMDYQLLGPRSLVAISLLVWLLALVVLPARSPVVMRFGLVIYLALLSIWTLPRRLWMDQLARVSLLSGILFLMLGLGSDGAPPLVQPRSVPSAITGIPHLPASLQGYSYLIWKLGPLQLTRKGLSVASTAACLTFTVFQSASLCLTTTAPEQLAYALRWYLGPLMCIGVPVAEIILTLLLSLRFINLVFDEVRNVAMGIVSRRINWQQLTTMETIDVFVTYIRRIFKNVFSHAEQISQAMILRGFRGESADHNIYLLSWPRNVITDLIALTSLVGLVGASVLSQYLLL